MHGGGPPRPPWSLLGSRWFHICREYLRGLSPVNELPPELAWWRQRTEVAVDGMFFWLAGVGDDGRQRAENDGGGC